MPNTADWFSDVELRQMIDADAAEGVQFFMCADLEELVDVFRRFTVIMSAGPDLEAELRAVCSEKGISFSPQMAAVCDSQANARKLPCDLDEMVGPYGGLDAFLAAYCPEPVGE